MKVITYYVIRKDGQPLHHRESRAEAIAKASEEAVRLHERMEVVSNYGAHVMYITERGISEEAVHKVLREVAARNPGFDAEAQFARWRSARGTGPRIECDADYFNAYGHRPGE